MAHSPGQGRFGKPPVEAQVMAISRQPDGRWKICASSRRTGEDTWERLTLSDLTYTDLVEAVAVESQRYL